MWFETFIGFETILRRFPFRFRDSFNRRKRDVMPFVIFNHIDQEGDIVIDAFKVAALFTDADGNTVLQMDNGKEFVVAEDLADAYETIRDARSQSELLTENENRLGRAAK
jgi:hypothetical protein